MDPPHYSDVLAQPANTRKKIIFSSKPLSSSMYVFSSIEDMLMFKRSSRSSPKEPDFSILKQQQNSGRALPLFILEREVSFMAKESPVMNILACLPSPNATDRLYDRVDNRQIGKVYERSYFSYLRYRLHLRGHEITVILHRRLPIVDFQLDGQSIRFVRQKPLLSGCFSYKIFRLDEKQPSLIDNLSSTLELDKGHIMLRSSKRIPISRFFEPQDAAVYESSMKIGVFDNTTTITAISGTQVKGVLNLAVECIDEAVGNGIPSFVSQVIVCVCLIVERQEKLRLRSFSGKFGFKQ